MKKGVLKILTLAVALCAALPCAVTPAFANSGMRYEHGVTSAGVQVNETSALAVESEKLTFDIVDYPEYGDISDYKSTVTAEYKFVNTSETDVVTGMAFPMKGSRSVEGKMPAPKIMLDGVDLAVQTRHTCAREFDFSKQVKFILDDFYSDGFYNTELPVTKVTCKVDAKKRDDLRVTADVTCGENTRFMAMNNDINGFSFYPYNGSSTTHDVYVFGDVSGFSCDWKVEEYVDHIFAPSEWRSCSRNVTTTVGETVTLKQFALKDRGSDSAINEIDWFNSVVMNLGDGTNAEYSSPETYADEDFTTWYTYEVRVAAGGSVIHSVTAPVYPDVVTSYMPNKYDYEYFLSPASSWKSFGTLDIAVNCDAYMLSSSVKFQKVEGGFRASLDNLPKGELEFELCESENPDYHHVGVNLGTFVLVLLILVAVFLIGAVVTAIVYLVKARKKQQK